VAIGLETGAARARYGLLLTALAPVVPQILGSAFNIWYNTTVIEPLLVSPVLKQRFAWTWILYTIVAFLIGLILWLKRVRSLGDFFRHLQRGQSVEGHRPPLEKLTEARRQLIHLPWFAAAICGVAWFLCIPVFLGALLQVQSPLDPDCCGICRFRSAFRASSRSRIHFFWSNSPVTGDCSQFSFGTRAPIAHRTSLRSRSEAGESCGRFPLQFVRSLHFCC